MKYYIYVDDIRNDKTFFTTLKDEWHLVICRNYVQTLTALKQYQGFDIIIDHDLGEMKSGYDICKWIVENEYPLTAFHLHSMNAVGVHNMRQLLQHYGYSEI